MGGKGAVGGGRSQDPTAFLVTTDAEFGLPQPLFSSYP